MFNMMFTNHTHKIVYIVNNRYIHNVQTEKKEENFQFWINPKYLFIHSSIGPSEER